jgi:hypothetical protein
MPQPIGPQAGALLAANPPLALLLVPWALNAESAFSAFPLPHVGHSGSILASRDRTNFSNLLPQSWHTYS